MHSWNRWAGSAAVLSAAAAGSAVFAVFARAASIALAAVILAAGLSALPVQARVWSLQPDGSGDAPSIQAALNGAAPGDVVRLAPGLYKEILVWPDTPGLILEGADPDPENTIVDGAYQNGVIAIEVPVDSTTVIRRLKIVNGDPVGT